MVTASTPAAGWKARWREQWRKPVFRWSVVAVASLVVVFLCLVALFFYPESPAFRERSLVARAAPSKDRPVEIETRLDENLFERKGATAELLVTVTDRAQVGDATHPGLSGVEVYVHAPGFAVSGDKALAADRGRQFYICEMPQHVQGKPSNVLAPGESCTAKIGLTAAERSGMSAMTVFVDWTEVAVGSTTGSAGGNAAGNTVAVAPEEVSLSLGPVKFDSMLGPARWNRLGRRAAQVLRDLTIPIVLALIGIWFNWKQNLREAKRIKADKKQADRQQVRMLLLKTVMKLAKSHYLPIVAEAKAVVLEGRKDKAGRSADQLFFHMLMLLKRIDELKMKEGAVFFQKRFGEAAVGHAWTILKAATYGVLGEELVSAALTGVVKTDWEYVRFVESRRKLVKLRERFEHWLDPSSASDPTSPFHLYGPFEQYLGVIDVLQAVFRFEADRPLSEGWYEEKAKVDFKMPPPTKIPAFGGDRLSHLRESAQKLKETLEESYGRSVDLV